MLQHGRRRDNRKHLPRLVLNTNSPEVTPGTLPTSQGNREGSQGVDHALRHLQTKTLPQIRKTASAEKVSH